MARLPTGRQRLLARYTLVTPFLQAVTGVLVPVSFVIDRCSLKTPRPSRCSPSCRCSWSLATVAIEVVGLHEFGRDYGVRVRFATTSGWSLGTVPYQWLLAVAAMRAVLRELRDERGWEKTEHAVPTVSAVTRRTAARRP